MRHAARTQKRLVFARHELVDAGLAGTRPSVLLEGSWPPGTVPELFGSLDDEIDARLQGIDEEASRLAERLAEPCFLPGYRGLAFPSINPAWLNALGLRYYLVKLIRLVAYFTEVRPLAQGQTLQLVAAKGRDEDYADLTAALCRLAGAYCRVEWIDRPRRPAPPFAANRRWRRGLARLLGLVDRPRLDSASRGRVVLCGNPRLLDPVCRELVGRDSSVWWLYDRFALRSWLRWRASGVGQLVCDSSQSRENRLVVPALERLECRGVDLRGPVRRWIADRLKSHGPQQTRILEQIDAHFRRVRPEALVLDEDATPLARAAVGLARRHGATSFVVQHGAPVCRFGFAPAAADRILVWGQSSQKQLTGWGVPAERIQVVGSATHEALYQELSRAVNGRSGQRVIGATRSRPPRILLLATVPPRDDRPDAVALHFNRRTYAGMLHTALAAVSTIPGAELVVKLHPRAPNDPIARAAIAAFPSVETRVVRGGSLKPWLAWTDCVLSCFSSAGIDATLARVPVIQLLPVGSGDVLPHQQWGLLGSARTEGELRPLLLQAKSGLGEGSAANPNPNVFAHLDGCAAERIAGAALGSKRKGDARRAPTHSPQRRAA